MSIGHKNLATSSSEIGRHERFLTHIHPWAGYVAKREWEA